MTVIRGKEVARKQRWMRVRSLWRVEQGMRSKGDENEEVKVAIIDWN